MNKLKRPLSMFFIIVMVLSLTMAFPLNAAAGDSSIASSDESGTTQPEPASAPESIPPEDTLADSSGIPPDGEVPPDTPEEDEDEKQKQSDPLQSGDVLVLRDGYVELSNNEFRLTDGVYVTDANGVPRENYHIEIADAGGFDIHTEGEYAVLYNATNNENDEVLTGTRRIYVQSPFFTGVKSSRLRSAEYRIRIVASSVYTYNGLCEAPGTHTFQMDTAWASYVLESTGERAYCVETGVYDEASGGLIPYYEMSGSDKWNSLSNDQQRLIVLAQYYGRLNNDVGDEAVTIAVQTLIWEISNNYVMWSPPPYREKDLAGSGFLTHNGAANGYWSDPRAPYNALVVMNGIEGTYNSLVAQMRRHYILPSFAFPTAVAARQTGNILMLPQPTKNSDGSYSESQPLVLYSDPSVLATWELGNLAASNPYIRVDLSAAGSGFIRVWAKQPIAASNPYIPMPPIAKVGFSSPDPVTLLLGGTLPSGNPAQAKMVVRVPDPLYAFVAFATEGHQQGFSVAKRDAVTGEDITPIPMRFRITGPSGFNTWEGQLPVTFKDVPVGNYQITELQAPYGYYIEAGKQTLTVNADSDANTVVYFENKPQTGQIIVHKVDAEDSYLNHWNKYSGLDNKPGPAHGVGQVNDTDWFGNGPTTNNNGLPGQIIDPFPQGDASFKGAHFEIRAAEDIIYPQRQDRASLAQRPLQYYERLLFMKGELVETVITGTATQARGLDAQLIPGQYVTVSESGVELAPNIAISSLLPLGKYTFVETILPEGYQYEGYKPIAKTIEIDNGYTTQDFRVNSHEFSYANSVIKGHLSITKFLEGEVDNDVTNGGTPSEKTPCEGIYFAVYLESKEGQQRDAGGAIVIGSDGKPVLVNNEQQLPDDYYVVMPLDGDAPPMIKVGSKWYQVNPDGTRSETTINPTDFLRGDYDRENARYKSLYMILRTNEDGYCSTMDPGTIVWFTDPGNTGDLSNAAPAGGAKGLPYGRYRVVELNQNEGFEAAVWSVRIGEESRTDTTGLGPDESRDPNYGYQEYSSGTIVPNGKFGTDHYYIIENKIVKQRIEVYKRDNETNKLIPLAGTKFMIWSWNNVGTGYEGQHKLADIGNLAMGRWIEQTTYYPSKLTTRIFATNAEGWFALEEPLVYGDYTLVEIASPYGYWLPDAANQEIADIIYQEALKKYEVDLALHQAEMVKYQQELAIWQAAGGENSGFPKPVEPTAPIEPQPHAVYNDPENANKDVKEVPRDEDGNVQWWIYTVDEHGNIIWTEDKYGNTYNGVQNTWNFRVGAYGQPIPTDDPYYYNDITVIIDVPNENQKGYLILEKTGMQLTGSTQGTAIIPDYWTYHNWKNEHPNEEGSIPDMTLGLTQPVWTVGGLPGAVYEIRAAEDIITPEGTVRYTAGELVETITTDSRGVAISQPTYLGRYTVQEVKSPYGYILDDTVYEMLLEYQGQEVRIFPISQGYFNIRQNVRFEVYKQLEEMGAGLGATDKDKSGWVPAHGVIYGLFVREDIYGVDESAGPVLPAGALVEVIHISQGKGQSQLELPLGKYFLKELYTAPQFVLDETEYDIEFKFTTDDTEWSNREEYWDAGYVAGSIPLGTGRGETVVIIRANEGVEIRNELIRGSVEFIKTDFDFKGIPDGVITGELATSTAVEKDGAVTVTEIYVDGRLTTEVVRTYTPHAVGSLVKAIVSFSDGRDTQVYEYYTLKGAQFTLYDEHGVARAVVTSDDRGFCRISGVPYGRWILRETRYPEGFMDLTADKAAELRQQLGLPIEWLVIITENGQVVQPAVYDANNNATWYSNIENLIDKPFIEIIKFNEDRSARLAGIEFTLYRMTNAEEYFAYVAKRQQYEAALAVYTQQREQWIADKARGSEMNPFPYPALKPPVVVFPQYEVFEVLVTDRQGYARSSHLEDGYFRLVETKSLPEYTCDFSTEFEIRAELMERPRILTFEIENAKKPYIEIIKYNADGSATLQGAVFELRPITNGEAYRAYLDALAQYKLDMAQYEKDLENVRREKLVGHTDVAEPVKPAAPQEVAPQYGGAVQTLVTNESGYARSGYVENSWFELVETQAPSGFIANFRTTFRVDSPSMAKPHRISFTAHNNSIVEEIWGSIVMYFGNGKNYRTGPPELGQGGDSLVFPSDLSSNIITIILILLLVGVLLLIGRKLAKRRQGKQEGPGQSDGGKESPNYDESAASETEMIETEDTNHAE